MLQSTFYHRGETRAVGSDDWPGLIATGGYSAIIFDCDGTLVNSGEGHFRALQAAVNAQGASMDRAWYNARTGLDRKSTLDAFAQTISGDFDVSRAITQSIEAFQSVVHCVSAIPETVDLLRGLDAVFGRAVVTNAEKPVAEASLGAIDVLSCIDHLVTFSDGLPPKPAPDMFRLAAAKLDVSCTRVLVFEDSPQGVAAALAADMDVVLLLFDHVSDGR
ncbi:MAG: HAD family phosphatase [Paracoccaceae bacterium]|nr:HAD family phosphatase [Paracoccaceae bacterium]